MHMARMIRAARGTTLRCRGWRQESLLRMLENVLEVGERPEDLVVYTAGARAARNWDAFDRIVKALTVIEQGETLVIQSGKPVGIFSTYPDAPLVVMANANLVGRWAVPEIFYDLDRRGLTMPAGFTAGGWQYIGTQGIAQGTYMTFLAAAHESFGGTLAGRLIVTSGCGGMGGAQPLAVTMNGGVALIVEVDPARIERRLETRYLDAAATSLDEAVVLVGQARAEGRALSVGVVGNAADVFPELLRRGVEVDIVTDQTSAHDPLNGYIPSGYDVEAAERLRVSDRDRYVREARASMARHCEAMVGFLKAGAEVFDYGNNLRGEAKAGGYQDAFAYPGFVPAYLRPLFCEGKGPFRWVALSGDPADIAATDRAVARLFPEDQGLHRWLQLAAERVAFQGLPARICWLGYGERDRAGLAFNELVRSGEVRAPIVIGRDHLDSGSVASPYRETEGMADGSDAIADWPILNALLNTASGAAWVAVHQGGGVGMGKSIHAGAQVVADGTEEGAERLQRVLTNDPGTGVMRHADAGYEVAIAVARERRIRLPMVGS
jgi:urocanate hydratase